MSRIVRVEVERTASPYVVKAECIETVCVAFSSRLFLHFSLENGRWPLLYRPPLRHRRNRCHVHLMCLTAVTKAVNEDFSGVCITR